jgi:hypothetical protein
MTFGKLASLKFTYPVTAVDDLTVAVSVALAPIAIFPELAARLVVVATGAPPSPPVPPPPPPVPQPIANAAPPMKIKANMLPVHRRLRGEANKSKDTNIDVPLPAHHKRRSNEGGGLVKRMCGDTIAVKLADAAGRVRERVVVADVPLLSVTDGGEKLHEAPAIAIPRQSNATVLV